jgi:hypothetical protein
MKALGISDDSKSAMAELVAALHDATGVAGPSELQPCEARCAVSQGSLPVSRAEVLDVASQLEHRAAQCAAESGQPQWQHPGHTRESLKRDEAVLLYCAKLLRHGVEATVRQPEENNQSSERGL